MPDTARTRRRADTIRKAAILVATLDRETADELLAKMDDQQAAQVREAVLDLDEFSRNEQDEVIHQFLHSSHMAARHDDDGVELDASLARKLQSPHGYDDAPREPAPKRVPFHFLHDARTDPLVRHLERQHPQLIAVVVAHLPPDRAAEVVKRLAPKTQADVLRRVAELDQADPEIVRDVEEELELLLSGELRAGRNRSAGLPVVAAILNAAGTERAGMFGNLASHERELANLLEDTLVTATSVGNRQLGPDPVPMPARSTAKPSAKLVKSPKSGTRPLSAEMVAPRREDDSSAPVATSSPTDDHPPHSAETIQFDALEQLDDDAWAALIRAAEPQLILLALAGATERLVNRIMRGLTTREANALRDRLERAGPLRLADIDRAQRSVGELAGRLAAQGVIQLPAGRIVATA